VAQALRHPSFVRENDLPPTDSNQRLEFLGDAVLDLILADHLFAHASEFSEGQLTKLKSTLAREGSLAQVGRALQLGDYVLLGRGEEDTGGRNKASILADTVEALLAAVYVAHGFEAARGFVLTHFAPGIEHALANGPATDPKSLLQETLQERLRRLPEYRTHPAAGPAHSPQFESEVYVRGVLVGRGTGRSKREAEGAAAREALSDLDAMWAAVRERNAVADEDGGAHEVETD
jgi:ribonuclease III